MLRVDHPDILEFIRAKDDERALPTFNLSVAVTGAFMEAVGQGGTYPLINPRTGTETGTSSARDIFEEMVKGSKLSFLHPMIPAIAARFQTSIETVLAALATHSSCLPNALHHLLATAYEISPSWHVRMQAVFQEHVDAGVSKTVNLPEQVSPAIVREVFLQAHRLGCKGITVYRNTTRPDQPLRIAGLCTACDAPV